MEKATATELNLEHLLETSLSLKNPCCRLYKITEDTQILWHPLSSLPQDPSLKETSLKEPSLSFDDIGGLKSAVKSIRDTIELPLYRPDLFQQLQLRPPRGLLLYGPPGTGKTFIARVLSNVLRCHFISINGADMISKYYGNAEAKVLERLTILTVLLLQPSLTFLCLVLASRSISGGFPLCTIHYFH